MLVRLSFQAFQKRKMELGSVTNKLHEALLAVRQKAKYLCSKGFTIKVPKRP